MFLQKQNPQPILNADLTWYRIRFGDLELGHHQVIQIPTIDALLQPFGGHPTTHVEHSLNIICGKVFLTSFARSSHAAVMFEGQDSIWLASVFFSTGTDFPTRNRASVNRSIPNMLFVKYKGRWTSDAAMAEASATISFSAQPIATNSINLFELPPSLSDAVCFARVVVTTAW